MKSVCFTKLDGGVTDESHIYGITEKKAIIVFFSFANSSFTLVILIEFFENGEKKKPNSLYNIFAPQYVGNIMVMGQVNATIE
jgi:hypothetical protein